MNIDLLPVSALALDPFGRPPADAGDVQTLTLQLALGTTRGGLYPMAGSASTGEPPVARAGAERAAVLRCEATALTITF
jgi:hypothetical protein